MESGNTDGVTLEYLLNPVYHTGVFQSKSKQDAKDDPVSNVDVKFYRKRISALSRDIMRGNVANTIVQEAHDEYVKAAIQYFKVNDKTEILQKEHESGQANVERKGEDQTLDNNKDNNKDSNFDIGMVNKAFFEAPETRQPRQTLDNFVTSKTLKIAEPVKHPQRRQINLKTKELRMKGVPRNKRDKQHKQQQEQEHKQKQEQKEKHTNERI